MFKKILLGLVAVIAVILIVGAFQSGTYRVERSVTIAAPAAEIFPRINDVHRLQEWSPWVKLDPNAKMTFDGPASGVGAGFAWAGNSAVGEGRETITTSTPNEHVQLKLEFIQPMADIATTDFHLQSAGAGTQVTWSIAGHKNYITKVMCLFVGMDKLIGGDFERGLANLKSQVESPKK
jgi:carbon monoxide dehydrogenase subunit G